jgi:hypothetical protein
MKGIRIGINWLILVFLLVIGLLLIVNIAPSVKGVGERTQDDIEFSKLCAQWNSIGCGIGDMYLFETRDGRSLSELCSDIGYSDAQCQKVCLNGCI